MPIGTTNDTETAPPLRVNLVSATVKGTQGHGVHTAFLQTRAALDRIGAQVTVNSSAPYDIAHYQTMDIPSLFRLLRNRHRGVVTAHVVPASFVGSLILARVWLPVSAAYLRFFYGAAAEVVAVSPDVAYQLERMELGVPVRYVPNAVDCSLFGPDADARAGVRGELGIADEAFVAICVGQVQPRKGVDTFIATAREHPELTFVWVGDMPFGHLTADRDRMLKLVAAAPSNCRFVGGHDHEDMPRWYAAADCLFFPSRQETFGLAIVEAAAAGLPLLVGDLDTYRPLFGDAVIASDPADFGSWLTRLHEDGALRSRYSQAALQLARRFDTSRLAERLLEVYNAVIARAELAEARSGSARRQARRISTLAAWRDHLLRLTSWARDPR